MKKRIKPKSPKRTSLKLLTSQRAQLRRLASSFIDGDFPSKQFESLLQRYLLAYPNCEEGRLFQARYYMLTGKHLAATQLLQQMIKSNPHFTASYGDLAELLLTQSDFRGSAQCVEQFVNLTAWKLYSETVGWLSLLPKELRTRLAGEIGAVMQTAINGKSHAQPLKKVVKTLKRL